MKKNRLSEDISLVTYVGFTLMVMPYLDSWSRTFLDTWSGRVVHLLCVMVVCVILISGMRLASRFCEYGMWGWRETLFVGLLGTYSITGYIIRPHEPILREVGWVVCVLVQGIVLACAQYLEGWFHDTQKHKTNEESLKLAHQVCWHIFAACWTAFASVIVLAGIVIGFSGSVEARVNGELKSNILVIILYLLLTIIPVFIWMMRPCFQKSLRIILELDEMNR